MAGLGNRIGYAVETVLYLGDLSLLPGLFLLAVTALLDTLLCGRQRWQ